jgi:hypothetical protein
MSWQLGPEEATDGRSFGERLVEVHQDIHRRCFQHDPAVNHGLPVQVRALRRIDDWQVCLLLTPWMLSRIYRPDSDPGIPVPADWSPEARADAEYSVIGPAVTLHLLGGEQKTHLNYEPRLGHYLMQPLVLNMEGYRDAEAVYEAWNEVIRTRDENMRKMRRDCPWQKEVSRREFFRRLRGDS